MNKLAFILGLTLVAGAGYYFGAHSGHGHGDETTAAVKAERKILYYRNPMGLPDTSPVPKKDSMGMDYVPVYEGDAEANGTVAIAPEKVQLLGVRSEPAQRRLLQRTVKASAVLEVDERKQHWIAPRFGGWVKQLYVNQTGMAVAAGAPLLAVYSPELESAAREYQLARESNLPEVERSARKLLGNWEIAPQDLAHLEHGGALLLRAPTGGTVLEKNAIAGARFAAGDVLFKLADLSQIWLQADIAEQDQGVIRTGQTVEVKVDAYPGEIFRGKASFIAPVVNGATRTVRLRVELSNRDGRLRPGMYASVEVAAPAAAAPVLSVPQSAVLESDGRSTVLVQLAQGRFQPRAVQLGQRGGEWVEVRQGLAEGEQVVTRANFLIDAESNLRAALGGMQPAPAVQMPSPDELPQHQHSGPPAGSAPAAAPVAQPASQAAHSGHAPAAPQVAPVAQEHNHSHAGHDHAE
ncbi:MAG: efflux RND transporter periplasmic adaptor subunit [Pseudomonadota bacterium]